MSYRLNRITIQKCWTVRPFAHGLDSGARQLRIDLSAAEMRRGEKKDYVPPMAKANVYLGLGEKERTLDLLKQAYLEHDVNLAGLRAVWVYQVLASEPRFQNLPRRMNFPSSSANVVKTSEQ